MVKRRTMGTVQDLRTAQKARLKCKPMTKGQEFLDLYILSKLKERFEREQERVADGMKYVLKDMADISKEVEKVWAADKEAIERIAGKSLAEIRRTPVPGAGRISGRSERGGKRMKEIEY